MSECITGLAFQRGIPQQQEPLRMPRRIPVGGGRSIENETGQSQSGGDVHGAAVVADEELGSCHERYEGRETCWLFPSHRRRESFLFGNVLGDPDDGMALHEFLGQCDVAIHRPALVVSARTRMNENATRRISTETAEIRRGRAVWEGCGVDFEILQQGLGDLPVLLSDGIVQGDGHAMLNEEASESLFQQRADDSTRTAGAGHDVGGIALVIRDQAGIRAQGTKGAAKFEQLDRMPPGLIERAGFIGQRIDLGAGDAVELLCDGAGDDCDLGFRHGSGKRLNGGKKDDVVAELVHLEDEQLGGGTGIGIDHEKWELIIPMQSIL